MCDVGIKIGVARLTRGQNHLDSEDRPTIFLATTTMKFCVDQCTGRSYDKCRPLLEVSSASIPRYIVNATHNAICRPTYVH